MGRVRQVSLDPRRTKRVFECLYYHGKDLCVGCREMVCSTLSHLRGHRNMPWERRSADTIYREMRLFFPGIIASTAEEAARLAAEMPSGAARALEGCDGENIGALVGVMG